jgi:integrase
LIPEQVDDVLIRTAPDRLHNYIIVSLLTGGRTEELRALRWDHVHLDAAPPHIEVWRHQLKPVIQTGATAMDRLFGA